MRIGGPRTSLSGGVYGLRAASPLVSAWLGIDAASSMRVLCLWIFLLSSSSLLSLSGSLSVPASGDLSCTPSSAISASRLVVVKLGPCLRRGRFRRACDAERAKVRTDSDPPRCHSGGPACPARFWAAYCHASSGGTDKAVTAARSSTLSSVFQQTAHVSFGSEALSNAQSAIMFLGCAADVVIGDDDAG